MCYALKSAFAMLKALLDAWAEFFIAMSRAEAFAGLQARNTCGRRPQVHVTGALGAPTAAEGRCKRSNFPYSHTTNALSVRAGCLLGQRRPPGQP